MPVVQIASTLYLNENLRPSYCKKAVNDLDYFLWIYFWTFLGLSQSWHRPSRKQLPAGATKESPRTACLDDATDDNEALFCTREKFCGLLDANQAYAAAGSALRISTISTVPCHSGHHTKKESGNHWRHQVLRNNLRQNWNPIKYDASISRWSFFALFAFKCIEKGILVFGRWAHVKFLKRGKNNTVECLVWPIIILVKSFIYFTIYNTQIISKTAKALRRSLLSPSFP